MSSACHRRRRPRRLDDKIHSLTPGESLRRTLDRAFGNCMDSLGAERARLGQPRCRSCEGEHAHPARAQHLEREQTKVPRADDGRRLARTRCASRDGAHDDGQWLGEDGQRPHE